MSRLETHLQKARTFQQGADQATSPEMRVEAWFLAAYHLIEACAAKHRIHIQKHQRVPDELERNSAILGPRSTTVADAFRYLDNNARAKFVYGDSGTKRDLAKARSCFEEIEAACQEALG